MNCAFQDFENLYLVMDLLTGGDLRYHTCKYRRFSEIKTRFFFACIILGLEYIHSNNIIHRDIKPENLVFDDKGYLRITDFGVAKIRKEDNSSETSGTPGYMAPEVLLAINHSFPVDFFAIGIMGYEFIYGERPYLGKSRKEIKQQVLRKQAKIDPDDIPDGWGPESIDFINSCLKRKDSKRLGFTGGVNDLKNHIWFKDFDWDALYNKTLRAPFIPPKTGNFDKKYCEHVEKHTEETLERYQEYRERKNFEKLFEGYTYINDEITRITSGNDTRMTTNTKYSKPMISTNPSANIDKRKNRISNIVDNALVFNTQKKNKFSDNVEKIYSNDNFNIISNKLLDSFENMEKNIETKKEKYKIQMIDANSHNYNNINEENTNLNIPPSSYTSLYNHYNRNMLEYSNVKNINDIITPNKKIVRSGSVGLIELENKKQSQKKGKYIEYNSNKLTGNKKSSINLYSNITNINPGDYNSIFNLVNKLEPNKIKIIHKSHIIENNSNSQRTKSNNNTNIENRARNILKLNNSKNTFYLPKLNSQKGIINNNNYEYSFANNNNNKQNNKSKNTLNMSQFKFKINKGVKKGLNFNNNKLFAFPSNNYKQIFKRSESTGFINLYNNNKSNRAIKNTSTSKKFNGLSNSLANLGIINNSKEKKIKRNASDLFLS
jgi:serine/threonine protein kinase